MERSFPKPVPVNTELREVSNFLHVVLSSFTGMLVVFNIIFFTRIVTLTYFLIIECEYKTFSENIILLILKLVITKVALWFNLTFQNIEHSEMSQRMRLWYLSHRRLAKAKASLRKGEPSQPRSLARTFAVRTHEVWK